MLEGITADEIERLLAEIDLSSSEDKLEPAERDRVDAERADEMNRRFEDVMLNERAEGKFLRASPAPSMPLTRSTRPRAARGSSATTTSAPSTSSFPSSRYPSAKPRGGS